MGHNHTTTFTLAGALGLLMLSALLGCSKGKVVAADSGNKSRVHASDFYATNTEPSGAAASVTSTPSTHTNPPAQSSAAESFTLSQPTHTPTQATQITRAPTNGSLELLDAKVGDINGHPIYANTFFAPISDRLSAEAQRLSPAQWNRIVMTRLDGIIADELLRAEAIASLSQQQRLGLRSFLQGFRSDLLSENLGSQELANRRILEEQGITLDEAMRRHEIDSLIQITLYREINRRVNVSWRDIKQRYERDLDKYAPPPTAIFKRIRVFTSSEADIASVTEQLTAGVSFEKIAASKLNTFKPDIGGEESFLVEGEFSETIFYGNDTLNEKAWTLSPGEWTGPFESGSSTYWLKLAEIEQNTISLYDAQLAIQNEITIERRQNVQREYLTRLTERAHFSSYDEILTQLIEIAKERYTTKQ